MADERYPQGSEAGPTPSSHGGATTSDSVDAADAQRVPLHAVALSILRALISLAIVAWMYSNWDPRFGDRSGVIFMCVGLAIFVAWTIWQGRRIAHARYPGLRAVEVLATVIPLFLIVFAGTYYSLSIENPASFNEPLDKGSALYFTIVVLSTTGFGDIVPRSGWARSAVNTQMIIDLFFVALILRFILSSVNKGREQRAQGVAPPARKRLRPRAADAATDE